MAHIIGTNTLNLMQYLPSEVMKSILYFVPRPQFLSLRLVCKIWGEIAIRIAEEAEQDFTKYLKINAFKIDNDQYKIFYSLQVYTLIKIASDNKPEINQLQGIADVCKILVRRNRFDYAFELTETLFKLVLPKIDTLSQQFWSRMANSIAKAFITKGCFEQALKIADDCLAHLMPISSDFPTLPNSGINHMTTELGLVITSCDYMNIYQAEIFDLVARAYLSQGDIVSAMNIANKFQQKIEPICYFLVPLLEAIAQECYDAEWDDVAGEIDDKIEYLRKLDYFKSHADMMKRARELDSLEFIRKELRQLCTSKEKELLGYSLSEPISEEEKKKMDETGVLILDAYRKCQQPTS